MKQRTLWNIASGIWVFSATLEFYAGEASIGVIYLSIAIMYFFLGTGIDEHN